MLDDREDDSQLTREDLEEIRADFLKFVWEGGAEGILIDPAARREMLIAFGSHRSSIFRL